MTLNYVINILKITDVNDGVLIYWMALRNLAFPLTKLRSLRWESSRDAVSQIYTVYVNVYLYSLPERISTKLLKKAFCERIYKLTKN